MSTLFSLLLAVAAAPVVAAPPPSAVPARAVAVARVSAEVLRAATTAPLPEPGAVVRQMRGAAGGQVLLEFD